MKKNASYEAKRKQEFHRFLAFHTCPVFLRTHTTGVKKTIAY